ncbi:serine hydrolase domain-containing protein [Aurantiacibacter suaedae]|uniref:serine hydrolase domain-containing protein n=1 Tax=Aurantiacibacter suaedae TaxID=2545755 RepID=UPI0010F70602|nr:serine hydrolase [Aurantiacibacter suaedae]
MPRFATPCPKLVRRPSPSHLGLAALTLPLALLAGCSQDGPPPLPPLPEGALEAVVTDPGVPREPLARAVDDLFTAEGIGTTYALVVLHEGEIVAERYGEGMSADTRFIGWSMSKTVTAALIGMLVADGRLQLDDPAPVPSWQRAGDPRGEITLRHLLQMRSGLRHREGYDPTYESSEVQMLLLSGRDDMAAFAEAQALESMPGEEFRYSTATSVILADIATDLIAPDGSPVQRQQAMASFLDARLAAPLGMESMVGEYDAAGTLVGGSSIWATARDWGKFGEFLRHGGSVKGAQIVPRRWIEFMRTTSPASPDYGAQTWLNLPSGGERNELFAARGPDTAFAAVGHLGQYVIVSPEQKLTVVRLGKTDGPQRYALVEQLADIVQLYPGR